VCNIACNNRKKDRCSANVHLKFTSSSLRYRIVLCVDGIPPDTVNVSRETLRKPKGMS